jgi:hypothetical protein
MTEVNVHFVRALEEDRVDEPPALLTFDANDIILLEVPRFHFVRFHLVERRPSPSGASDGRRQKCLESPDRANTHFDVRTPGT